MSVLVAQKDYLISTAIGNMRVHTALVRDFDVEDIVHNQAMSQGRLIQFLNIGQKIDETIQMPVESLPTVFVNNGSE